MTLHDSRPAAARGDRLTDGARLWADLMAIADIGPLPGGGSCRLALSDEDVTARRQLMAWAEAAGCRVQCDPWGNIFATRPGRRPEAPHVLMGSHLDTQPHGGRFDGVLGVLAGLEVIRALNEAGIATDHPITLVNWTNEEGVRFAPGLTGAAGFVGDIPCGDLDAIRATDGPSFAAELQRTGQSGSQPFAAEICAYYELHIEQGPVLERAGVSIGVVSGIQAVRWLSVTLSGEDRHAGTTPGADRRDALMAAARMALDLRAQALALDPDLRLTIGRMAVEPGSVNTVPGRVSFTLDLRHTDLHLLDRIEAAVHTAAHALWASEGVAARVERLMDVAPAMFDPAMQAGIARAAAEAGLATLSLPSGAMHDASKLAQHVPTAMIFVPSHKGISHNEAEWTDPAHCADGLEVLARAVLAHAKPGNGVPQDARLAATT